MMDRIEEKTLELGERRRITMRIWLTTGQSFVPTDCRWELKATGCTRPTIEAQGAAEVEEDGTDWYVTAEISPREKRVYKLQFIFGLGSEIIRRTVYINVR